ncbi:MAG: SAM-dependent methyltransferase [Verrucomicrobia bacterium]|nr:SAM-dependent methyltransferase [Verrucomicrobiota bacterium]
MSGKSPGLEARLAAEIQTSGPIPFDRFMERALYDPEDGYYSSGKSAIGKQGDFFTNVSIGPIYGEVLVGQFVEMWQMLGRPAGFTLIEQGAGDGQLAQDILNALAATALAGAPLIVIEPSDALRKIQSEKLSGHDVSWVANADALPELCGVHYSNELFDAFPVHIIRSTGGGWAELYVDRKEESFTWLEMPVAGELAGIVAEFPARAKGFTSEVCLAHRPLLQTIAAKITRGFLLAVDYGMSRESLLAEHRTGGTLSCYRGHRRDSNPLESPGQKDLTAHVNFSLLAQDAVEAGWQFGNFTDQHHFLVGAATSLLLSMDGKTPDAAGRKTLRSLKMLLHPESMGRQFHAILFSKGVSGAGLSGFQYAGKIQL